MTSYPSPLLPADVDLRGYDFMPLHVVSLRQSGFASRVSGDEFRAGTMLWAASWHEVPASSVPNDDHELAKLAGYGFAIGEWRKLKQNALYNFVLCSDGRYYHHVVAAVAWESWLERLKHYFEGESERVRANNKRAGENESLKQPMPTLPSFVRAQYPASARRLDELDRLEPPQGWLSWVGKKKRVRRTKLVCPPDNGPPSAGQSEMSAGRDTLYMGEIGHGPPDVRRITGESPPVFPPKREGEGQINPPKPPDAGGDLAVFAGLPEGFEGRRGADFLAFWTDWDDATAPIATVARAWCEVEADIPPHERLAAAMAEFRRLNAAKAATAKRQPAAIGPARFLRERQWGPLLSALDQRAAVPNARLAAFRAEWGDHAEAVLKHVGDAAVLSWLHDASLNSVNGEAIIGMRHASAVSHAETKLKFALDRAFPNGWKMEVRGGA